MRSEATRQPGNEATRRQRGAGRRELRLGTCGILLVALCAASAWGQEAADTLARTRGQVTLTEITGVLVPPTQPGSELDNAPAIRELYEEARNLAEDREYRDALAKLDEALNAAEHDYYELFYLMGLCKYRVGRFGEARAAAEHAARLRPGAADVHYLLGLLFRRQGQLDRAIEQLRTATLAADRELNNPRVTAAWYELARCLAAEGYALAAAEAYGRLDEALWDSHPEHRQAEEIAPFVEDHPYGAVELRIGLLERLGRKADALRVALQAVEVHADAPYVKRLCVRTLLGAGQTEEAWKYCEQRLTDPSKPTAYLALRVDAAQAAGRLDAWVSEVMRAVEKGAQIEAAGALARQLERVGAQDAAVRVWRVLAAQPPGDSGAAWGLATALRSAGQHEAALESLAEHVRAHPDAGDLPWTRLVGWMSVGVGDDELRQVLARWNERTDRDFATNFVLGLTAVAVGETELAERLFNACVEARPDFALALVAWAQWRADQYCWDEAQRHAEEALRSAPRLGAAHFVLAQAQAGLDEDDAAEKSFKSALRHQPTEATFALRLADYYRRVGNELGAQRYYQEALLHDPANARAAEELIDSYLGGNKIEIARTQLGQAEASELSDDALRRMRTAVGFVRTLFQDEHLAELERQLAAHPDDAATGLKLAAGLFIRERIDEAYRVAQPVYALTPEDERLLSLLARIHTRRLAFEEAIGMLEQLAERYPNRVAVLSGLAETYLADFRLDAARATLRRILAREPPAETRDECRSQLLNTYVEFSEFDTAVELLDGWMRESPDDDRFRRAKVGILRIAGRSEEARQLAQERIDSARTDAERNERQLALVELCIQTRAYEDALERVRAWLQIQPGNGGIVELLVDILLEAQRFEEAQKTIEEFRSVTGADATQARVWYGRLRVARGELDEGLAEYDALLDMQLVHPAIKTELRRYVMAALLDARRFDDALARCEEWLTGLGAGDASVRLQVLDFKRRVLQAAERDDQYAAVMETLLAAAPSDPGLNNDLGYTWADAGRNLERATRMIRRAVAAEPLNAAYLDSLGWVSYKAGDFAAARKYLGRATRLREGQDAVLYDHLGDADYRAGDEGAARRHWEKARELAEVSAAEDVPTARSELPTRLKTKLDALERSETPPLAPLAEGEGNEATRQPGNKATTRP